jgi:putative membrane protein
VSWWCSATGAPWSWSFQAYPGVWLVVGLLAVCYWRAWAAGRADGHPVDGRRVACFAAGLAVFWISTDWPLGLLGAGYLASAHMLVFLLYTLVAAPLMLLGIPEWMGRRLVAAARLDRILPVLSRPWVAGVTFNVVLLATHAPITVDGLRGTQFGSFALDLLWLLAGFLVWLPVICPVPERRIASPAVTCIYVFLALGALPMIPGAFLTFSAYPLYRTYELAPRVIDLSAGDDQQLAGFLMKVGSLPVIWAIILGVFIAWARRESAPPVLSTQAVDAPSAPATD